jgi:phenylalanyl-tRNA synthetase beta chain
LGIEIDPAEVHRILIALGNREISTANKCEVTFLPPSWRRDLTREIDLVEEVARIHGYDAIPEDVNVPMAASHRTDRDRALAKIREVLVAAGVSEAMTISLLEPAADEAFSPWTDVPSLISSTPVLRRADRLRRSLIPSLLEARKNNEAAGNAHVALFEIARVYLPSVASLPSEELMLGLTVYGDFLAAKGIIEAIVARLNPKAILNVADFKHDLFQPSRCCQLRLGDKLLGYLGQVSAKTLKQFELRESATVAEIKISALESIAALVPQAQIPSEFPAVQRDLNLVVDERIRWAELAATVEKTAGEVFEHIEYRDTYRDPQRLGPGKKSQLFSITLRGRQATLTNVEADQLREKIVTACNQAHGATLRA